MIFILLIFFFMYVFPIFFLYLPVIRTTSIVATILLVVGVVLYLVQTFMIYKFVTRPQKLLTQHEDIRYSGQLVHAEILNEEVIQESNHEISKRLLVQFLNLAGNPVKSYVKVVDSKPHEHRFERGKTIDLKLNKNGFQPPFTLNDGEYETKTSPFASVWIIFNIVYMIGFFIVTYYVQNDGYGWRFLSPVTSWLWAPISGIILLRILLKLSSSFDIVMRYHPLISFNSEEEFGELLLYGKTVEGEILSYSQTGLHVNEQPQVLFSIQYVTDEGKKLTKRIKNVISLTELHELKKGKAEIIYLPRDTDIFMVQFIEDE
ncbi:hypothetical protein [Nosocomiicoccus ampullae]|uniref:hypothetical protein n=1 Tax=Nosocomiicoccus ampullae TaxID=489910 RepID=UPI00254AEAF7|nr:hypothetical protein [Nosocomiicoccus ampullae]MDK6863908.1 hypothetical protein [Nosocomiicoccus ampullae]